jgi:hypothetical protein
MSRAECCWLCGYTIKHGRRRYQSTHDVQDFVRTYCKATPFVHQYLSTVPVGGEKAPICIPCVNWRRRCSFLQLKRNRKPYLHIDHLILYVMQPGKVQEPDHRCMARLFEAILQPTFVFQHLVPLPVKTIIQSMREKTYKEAVRAWWEYNGRTVFFTHMETAKRVRRLLKDE